LAIDHNMKFKNISFNSFDIRTHCDYWMRDMLSQRKEFAQAINQNHKFPFHFYNVTGTNFLQHLKDRHNLINHLIEKIPFGESCKNQEYVKSKKVYDDCNKMISSLLQQHRCDIQKHIFNLINNLTTLEANTLGIMLLEEQSFAVEINLLSHILELTHKNPLCIVLAGMYHCHNIEKRMLSQFESFEKDESQSMISPGMVLDNLFQLQLPKYVPESFLPKIAQKSIDEFQIRSNK